LQALNAQESDTSDAQLSTRCAPLWWIDGQILDAYMVPGLEELDEDPYRLPLFRGAAIYRQIPDWLSRDALRSLLGEPPTAEEERKQKERLEKLKRETPEQRAERLRRQEAESASLVLEVPKAFDFQLVGEDVVNDRPVEPLSHWK